MPSLPPDAALRIARFCRPDLEWRASKIVGVVRAPSQHPQCVDERFDIEVPEKVAAAERAIVEHGLGEEYGRELMWAIPNTHLSSALGACWLATAPLDVRVRALLAVVEAEEEKHQAPGAADEALAPAPAARQPGESQAEAVGSERLTSREPGPTSEAQP